MRPTGRAIFLFAAGVPLSLAVVLVDERLWPFGFALLAVVIFLTGLDGIRALSPGALEIDARPPGILYAGASDELRVTLSASRNTPPTEIEMLCDVSDNLDIPATRQPNGGRRTVADRAGGGGSAGASQPVALLIRPTPGWHL